MKKLTPEIAFKGQSKEWVCAAVDSTGLAYRYSSTEILNNQNVFFPSSIENRQFEKIESLYDSSEWTDSKLIRDFNEYPAPEDAKKKDFHQKLTHEVFSGQGEEWVCATVDSNGNAYLHDRLNIHPASVVWRSDSVGELLCKNIPGQFYAANWEKSKIVRYAHDCITEEEPAKLEPTEDAVFPFDVVDNQTQLERALAAYNAIATVKLTDDDMRLLVRLFDAVGDE